MKRIMLIAGLCLPLVCSAQKIAKYKGNAKAAVSYTFDDGLESHYIQVMPRLDSLGLRGTFWLIGRNIDIRKRVREVNPITWEEARVMAQHGHELGSHSYSHSNFKKMTPEQMREEVLKNDSAIYEHTRVHARSFCFPGNARTDSILDYVLSMPEVDAVRTYQKAVGGSQTGERAKIYLWFMNNLNSGGWAVGMTHGIDAGYDHFPEPAVLWDHLKQAKSYADKGLVWIAPFGEVSAYVDGRSAEVTYILDEQPKKITQKGKKLKPYQCWNGQWCVDALRDVPLKIKR